LGTVFQPYFNRTKSVKSPEMKDITNARTSRYCLITQEADTDGELETKLYKGDVIPTTSGGAQVVFNDVECLKQMSPTADLTPRKRKSNTTEENVKSPKKKSDVVTQARCSTGIEGHYSKKQRL
jgi:kinesin family member 23